MGKVQITHDGHRNTKKYFTFINVDKDFYHNLAEPFIISVKDGGLGIRERKERQKLAKIFDGDEFWTTNIDEAEKEADYYLGVIGDIDYDGRNLKDLDEKERIVINDCIPSNEPLNFRGGSLGSYNSRLQRFVD